MILRIYIPYVVVVVVVVLVLAQTAYIVPRERPTTQETETSRSLKSKRFKHLEIWRERVRICSRPCSSIFWKNLMGGTDRRSRNAAAKGKANAAKPWMEEASVRGPADEVGAAAAAW